MNKIILIILGIILISKTQANPDKDFTTANNFFKNTEYSNALKYYKSIENSGFESEDLYKNIGNCYYKLDKIEMAILYYEKGLKLNPSNEDLEYNLKLCNSKIIDKIESVPEFILFIWWKKWCNYLSSSQWVITNLIFFGLLLLSIAIFVLSGTYSKKKFWFLIALFFAISTTLTGFTAYNSYLKKNSKNTAILIAPSIDIKSSPDSKSKTIFILHKGTKITITDKLNEWVEIKIANGSKGWVTNNSFSII